MPLTGPASPIWVFLPAAAVRYPYGSQAPFWLITNYGLIQDNATKIHGKHEFQFGAGFRYEKIDKSSVANAGAFSANTLATSLYNPASTPQNPIATPQTGFGMANFMLGALNYQATFRRPWFHFRRPELNLYFQDNWKATTPPDSEPGASL